MDQRQEKGRATRERLIGVARTLFGDHGYEGTSIGAILRDSGVARGALYHHFATKTQLFDAVLDREVSRIAEAASTAALAAPDPVTSLRAGCATWIRETMDPAVQRITLLDGPAVVGWDRYRELDEKHMLGGTRVLVRRIAADGRLPADQVDMLTSMLLAAVGEAAVLIAGSDDPAAALPDGLAALDTLINRLVTAP